jgi:capsular polysaccharide biosynthesis protein
VTSADDTSRWPWHILTKRNSDRSPGAVSRWGAWLIEPGQIHISGLLLRPRCSLRLIALISALVLAACVLIPTAISALVPKVYGAQVEFVLQPRPELSDTAVERAMLTEEVILTSPPVLGPVAAQAGLSLEELESRVSTNLAGRSNVLRLTVADRDRERALSLVSSIRLQYALQYASIHANEPKSTPSAGPALTYAVLTRPRLLDKPLAPRPMQVLAAGALVGIGAAAVLAVLLLRPALPGRRLQQP